MSQFITRAAAQRILGVKTVYQVKLVKNSVLIVYAKNGGKCATFLSQKAFERDAIELRQNTSNLQLINLSDDLAEVINTHTAKTYLVDFVNNECTCPDHQYRQVTCKHLNYVQSIVRNSHLLKS